ncbi:heavy-metal-associated domain-containing protein [Corynebacterium alimapuense]|uniref:Transporter n=1 Tax=Corynebacterium alimapuense TaxID=1576874 RepID=A0A3M8K4F3_9CORY|nr:heavy-metal-associated domain-containing protein [Corynebacterium alimapuense]RNE48066.1 transporter [Corynebacterium alimapuense]
MIKHYVVDGMTCAHCKASVEEEINEIPGAQGVDADFESGRVVVTGEMFSDSDVAFAVENAGFTLRQDEEDEATSQV